MLIYRIALEKYASALTASGWAARWNPNGRYVLYAAQSRALACLENLVHRSGEGLSNRFKVMVIDLPDDLPVTDADLARLPTDWQAGSQYPACQAHGENWLRAGVTAVLRVPSALIPSEFNYLMSVYHPDFARIKLVGMEDFLFDTRFKGP